MNEHKTIRCGRLFTRKIRQFWLYLDGGGRSGGGGGAAAAVDDERDDEGACKKVEAAVCWPSYHFFHRQ